jgi:hypothetical protein
VNRVTLLILLAGLIVSARTRLNGTVLGQPVSVPVLWLIAAAVVLLLATAVLWVVLSIARYGFGLRPRTVRG